MFYVLALVSGYLVGLLSLLSRAISVCLQLSRRLVVLSVDYVLNTIVMGSTTIHSPIIVPISTTYGRVLQQYNIADWNTFQNIEYLAMTFQPTSRIIC